MKKLLALAFHGLGDEEAANRHEDLRWFTWFMNERRLSGQGMAMRWKV